jgi:hypothetical protein
MIIGKIGLFTAPETQATLARASGTAPPSCDVVVVGL